MRIYRENKKITKTIRNCHIRLNDLENLKLKVHNIKLRNSRNIYVLYIQNQ